MANRSVSLEGMIWADGAPDLPTTPVQGTTYRDYSITEAEINNGQPYNEAYDSSRYNEQLYRISSLIALAEQYGILPWCPTVDYPVGAICTGSDSLLYRSIITPNSNNDPVTSSGFWSDPIADASSAKSGLIKLATQTEVFDRVNTSNAITPFTLGNCYATETRRGIGVVATEAEVLAGTALSYHFVNPITLQAKINASLSSINTILSTVTIYDDPVYLASYIQSNWTDNGSFAIPIYKGSSFIGAIFHLDVVGGTTTNGVSPIYSLDDGGVLRALGAYLGKNTDFYKYEYTSSSFKSQIRFSSETPTRIRIENRSSSYSYVIKDVFTIIAPSRV